VGRWNLPTPTSGRVLRGSAKGTRLARAQALTTFFAVLDLRHQVKIQCDDRADRRVPDRRDEQVPAAANKERS
jgi:hypothetical protein